MMCDLERVPRRIQPASSQQLNLPVIDARRHPVPIEFDLVHPLVGVFSTSLQCARLIGSLPRK
jgi:hypothetical protein